MLILYFYSNIPPFVILPPGDGKSKISRKELSEVKEGLLLKRQLNRSTSCPNVHQEYDLIQRASRYSQLTRVGTNIFFLYNGLVYNEYSNIGWKGRSKFGKILNNILNLRLKTECASQYWWSDRGWVWLGELRIRSFCPQEHVSPRVRSQTRLYTQQGYRAPSSDNQKGATRFKFILFLHYLRLLWVLGRLPCTCAVEIYYFLILFWSEPLH